MVYVKVLSDANILLAAEALDSPIFVKWQDRHKIIISCPADYAQGIVALDGNVVYQLDGRAVLPERAEPGMRAVIICEEEYKACLDAIGNIDAPEPEPDPEPDTPEPEEPPMNAAQMRAKIIKMGEEITALAERNEFLENCIIEMSEVVYA